MKIIYSVVFLLITNLGYGLEISPSLNKKLEKIYSNANYSKGLDIISNIELPNSISYKNEGEYKDSKSLYMWKIIFMYKSNKSIASIMPEFIHYRKNGGVINSSLLNEINFKIINFVKTNFEKKLESTITEKEIVYYENLLNDLNFNLDSIKNKDYLDYKKLEYVGNNYSVLNNIDTFSTPVLNQTYEAAFEYAKNFKYKGINVEKISSALTKPFHTDELKVFSITVFMIYNLNYNINKFENIYTSENVLYIKNTTCQGYSEMFVSLCKYANIKAGIVIGGDINMSATYHAFNWVSINGKYMVLDITFLDALYTRNLDFNIERNKNLIDVILKSSDYASEYKTKLYFMCSIYHLPLVKTDKINIWGNVNTEDDIKKIFGIKRIPTEKEMATYYNADMYAIMKANGIF